VYQFYEKSQKSTLGFTIKTKEGAWIKARASNTMAEKLNKAITEEGIKKVTITGKYKEVSYNAIIKDKDGKQVLGADGKAKTRPVSFKELQVNELVKHKVLSIEGNIGKIENKTTPKGKGLTEILVIEDKVATQGSSEKTLYNVTIWDDRKTQIPPDVKLEVGFSLAVKGEGNILEGKNGKEYYSIQAWNVDRNAERLQNQIDALVDKKKENTLDKETDKPIKKSKDISKGRDER
jgi:hypothetical protein